MLPTTLKLHGKIDWDAFSMTVWIWSSIPGIIHGALHSFKSAESFHCAEPPRCVVSGERSEIWSPHGSFCVLFFLKKFFFNDLPSIIGPQDQSSDVPNLRTCSRWQSGLATVEGGWELGLSVWSQITLAVRVCCDPPASVKCQRVVILSLQTLRVTLRFSSFFFFFSNWKRLSFSLKRLSV